VVSDSLRVQLGGGVVGFEVLIAGEEVTETGTQVLNLRIEESGALFIGVFKGN